MWTVALMAFSRAEKLVETSVAELAVRMALTMAAWSDLLMERMMAD